MEKITIKLTANDAAWLCYVLGHATGSAPPEAEAGLLRLSARVLEQLPESLPEFEEAEQN